MTFVLVSKREKINMFGFGFGLVLILKKQSGLLLEKENTSKWELVCFRPNPNPVRVFFTLWFSIEAPLIPPGEIYLIFSQEIELLYTVGCKW